tara:strand:- start:25 stop:690 length:666 start_codon:yes stop_codon:yes gene_type:complete
MQADRPKQYLTLQNRYLIDHTLALMLSYPAFERLVLVLSADDPYWPHSDFASDMRIIRAAGGSERCYSVLNGLQALEGIAAADDWVVVHDVARPCLLHSDLDKLLHTIQDPGAILAAPVRDTMKRGRQGADNSTVAGAVIDHTVEREQLWHALTPQVFRYAELKHALQKALADGFEVTDEASAMEHLGLSPALVAGQASNIKVTRPEDLALAEFFLSRSED